MGEIDDKTIKLLIDSFGLLTFPLLIIGGWVLFQKAGQPGWGVLIPIYNLVLIARVAGLSGWWAILLLIPLVNIIAWIIFAIGVAMNFGKGPGTMIGLIVLPGIFVPIIAFGNAEYRDTASVLKAGPLARPVKA